MKSSNHALLEKKEKKKNKKMRCKEKGHETPIYIAIKKTYSTA
jgi:hypothetical protein